MTELDPAARPEGAEDRAPLPAAPLHAIVREAEGVPEGTGLLVLSGELDLASAPELRAQVDAVVREGAQRVVLDLADVQFMDSSMLKELLRAHGELSAREAELVLVAPQPPVQRLLELTRTGELFRIEDDRTAALAG